MGAHNDTANDYALFESGAQSPVIPVSGGTFNLAGRDRCVFTVGAGTYKLPNGTPKGVSAMIFATGAVVLTNAAGTHVVSIASGKSATLISSSSTSWIVGGGFRTAGLIDLPLTSWREVVSNDIAALGTAGTTGSGGVLATDTTPTLETVNGDTDSQLRVLWAAGNAHALMNQLTIPPDLDVTQPIVLTMRGAMAASADTPAMDVDAFFDEGDTKVETSTFGWTATIANRTATISASDIPSSPTTLSIEITPGTHATDAMTMYASYITYTRKVI